MIDQKCYTLIKVAEKGSFTKAAAELALSQPAVSQHIRLLEEALQVKLFVHSRSRIRLTPEGEIAVEYARRMVSLDANMRRALKNEQEQITSIVVGITHTMESNFVVETLASYVNSQKSMMIKILTDATERLYRKVRDMELDFAVVAGRIRDASLRYLQLDTDSLVLAVSPEHPLAGRSMVTIDELKREDLILRLPTSNTMRLFLANLETQNLSLDDFNIILELDNIATIKDLIRRNFGVSVLARSTCMDELKKHKLAVLSIENLSLDREINIVCRRDYEHPELLEGIVRKYNEM